VGGKADLNQVALLLLVKQAPPIIWLGNYSASPPKPLSNIGLLCYCTVCTSVLDAEINPGQLTLYLKVRNVDIG